MKQKIHLVLAAGFLLCALILVVVVIPLFKLRAIKMFFRMLVCDFSN